MTATVEGQPARLDPSAVRGIPWAYETRRFQALGHDFAVRTTHAGLGRHIDRIYGACASAGEPTTWYSMLHAGTPQGMNSLYVDAARIAATERADWLLSYLTWHVNRQAVERTDGSLILHAAAAVRDGVGVVFPARPEAGKTTLVAGLVLSGFRYLTDEAVAFETPTLRMLPYPKPLQVDAGSWPVLPQLAPNVEGSVKKFLSHQWHVPVDEIRRDAIAGPTRASLIVFPSYVAGAATVVEPMARSQAVVAMLRETFGLQGDGRRRLEVLADVVGGARCYRLISGDLDSACSAVDRLVAEQPARSGGEVSR